MPKYKSKSSHKGRTKQTVREIAKNENKNTRQNRIIDNNIDKIYQIPKEKILYHGTVWRKGESFTELEPQYSDFGVIWFTKSGDVAEYFSERVSFNDPDEIHIVMKIKIKQNLSLLDVEESWFELDGEGVRFKEFFDEMGIIDPRDIYTFLKKHPHYGKYDGAVMSGSVGDPGRTAYDDIVLFDTRGIEVIEYKYFDRKKGEWSDYMDLESIIEVCHLEEGL